MNQEIKAPEVRVIDDQNKHVGVMPLGEALKMAGERGVDLIEVGAAAIPPVCKLIDYGKYMYQQEKLQRESKKKQKEQETKETRLGVGISKHDLELKAGQVSKFLEEKNKVRIEMKLRGREKLHFDLAREKMEMFLKLVTVEFKRDVDVKKTPSGFFIIIGPK